MGVFVRSRKIRKTVARLDREFDTNRGQIAHIIGIRSLFDGREMLCILHELHMRKKRADYGRRVRLFCCYTSYRVRRALAAVYSCQNKRISTTAVSAYKNAPSDVQKRQNHRDHAHKIVQLRFIRKSSKYNYY